MERTALLWWKRLESNSLALTSFILIVAMILLRGWYAIHIAPPVLNQDESAILLNARFLAQNGVDEHGKSYPVVFSSFGDAKLPGYMYTTALFWKFVPIDYVVRLPAFLAGLATVFLTGAIVAMITRKNGAGLASALLLSLSPWSFHFSSIGFEAQLGLALFLGAIALWLRRPEKALTDVLGALLFLASCLTYNAPLLLAPVVGGALLFWRGRKKETLPFILFFGTALLIAVGLTLQASAQKKGIAFFQDASVLAQYPAYRAEFSGLAQKFFGNQWVYFAGIFMKNILHSFSWEFLVLRGGANPWHGIPKVGHLHFLIPLLGAMGSGSLLGLVWEKLKSKKLYDAVRTFVLIGVGLFSLLPAAITTDAPHATRSLFFFVALTVLAGWQLFAMYDRGCVLLPEKFFRFIRIGISMLLIGGFFLWWYPAPRYWSQAIDSHWYIGLEQALGSFDHTQYERIYIEDPEGVLYTRVANYEKLDAETFMSTMRRSAPAQTGLSRGEQLGKYSFIYQPSDAKTPGIYLEQKSNKEWGTIEL